MKDSIIFWTIFGLFFGVCLGLALWLTGCASVPKIYEVPSSPQVLYETVLKTNWLATAAIIGIAVSAFAFLNGSKTGIAGMVACFIALTMTLAVARYAQWLSIGGLTGSVGLMIYSIFTKDRALKEIVVGGQDVKAVFKSDTTLNSYDAIKNAFNAIHEIAQSPQTTKLVKKIKKEIK